MLKFGLTISNRQFWSNSLEPPTLETNRNTHELTSPHATSANDAKASGKNVENAKKKLAEKKCMPKRVVAWWKSPWMVAMWSNAYQSIQASCKMTLIWLKLIAAAINDARASGRWTTRDWNGECHQRHGLPPGMNGLFKPTRAIQ